MTEQATPASPIEADIELYGALVDKEPQKPPRSQWIDVWQQFRKHKGAVFGGGFLLFITLAVLFGPYLWVSATRTGAPCINCCSTARPRPVGHIPLAPTSWAVISWHR